MLLLASPQIGLTPLGFVRKIAERRSGKTKTGEQAELTVVNEHSEPVFNVA